MMTPSEPLSTEALSRSAILTSSFVAGLSAMLAVCACHRSEAIRPVGPDWRPLYNTTCIFQEGVAAACPTSYPTKYGYVSKQVVTVCCPGALEDAPLPTATAQPPWPPQPCKHTGIKECDDWVVAQYEEWQVGTPEERASGRHNLDSGCAAYRHGILQNGLEQTRMQCAVGLDSIAWWRTRRGLPSPPPTTTPTNEAQRRDRARDAIGRALQAQMTPEVCPHPVAECNAYTAAFYDCWKRATPEVRSFFERGLHVDCATWGKSGTADDPAMRELCQQALDAVNESPACTPNPPR